MKRRVYLSGTLILMLAAIPTIAWASGKSDLAIIRQATAKYHRLEVAEADGFVQLFECIDRPTWLAKSPRAGRSVTMPAR